MEAPNDIATQHFAASFAEAYESPARAAWKTARIGLLTTAFYAGVSYVLQKSINKLIDDNS
jgi:hypothetical protein